MIERSRAPVVIVWYATEEDWTAIRSFAADPERLETSYEAWVNVADEAEERIWSKGLRSVRVHLDPERLKAFCASRKTECTAEARVQYANAAFAVSQKK